MPIKNDPSVVTAQIQHALRNDVLSSREANRLLTKIKEDGVTEEEVKAVVDTLKAALAGGPDQVSLDTSTTSRQRTINSFLGRLNEEHQLPLAGPGGARPTGSVNWLSLMTMQHDAVAEPLGKPGFSGKELAVDGEGGLLLGGNRTDLKADKPSDETLGALWGLTQPGQMDGLPEKSKDALRQNLFGLLEQHKGTTNEEPGKYRKLVASNAAAGALAEGAASWSPENINSALALAKEAPTPLMQSLLLRGLDKATLSPEQKTARDAISMPEHADALLKQFDDLRAGDAKAGYTAIKGEAAQFGLSALSFAKTPAAIDNVSEGMGLWKDLNRDYSKPWDGEELSNMNNILEGYVDKYPQTAFQFGTFAKDAPSRIADVTNARAVESTTPQLEGNPPALGGFPLTREQADYVKTLLPNVKDDEAVGRITKSLAQANGLFEERLPSSWSTPTNPEKPMSQASFELFKKAATSYQEKVGASPNGKLDYNDFLKDFGSDIKDIHQVLQPRMRDLNAQPPRWNDISLSPETASFVKEQLTSHTRSSMSVENIGRALEIFGKANGGKVEGEGAAQFREMVTDYKANWPEARLLDFNKLERIASFKVQGKELPLCSINGQPVGFAEFYGKVGTSVAGAIDKSEMRQPWMADRWGFRARQSVELLDVVAEKAARGEGPIAALREKYPNHDIEVKATGRDGAHEQFLYVVKNGNREVGTFAQGSDGTIARHTGRDNPVLFSAQIGKEGELKLDVPQKISVQRFPLATTYDVGDKIDISWYDSSASNNTTEGEAFSTTSRVLEAEIMSYDTKGNYTVKYNTPDGTEATKTISSRELRSANNPHYFKPKASYFSDVTINVQTDEALKGFLSDAQPIIERYLPTDGSTANMTPQELSKRQKDCIKALMEYTSEKVKYPAHEGAHADANSQKYHDLVENGRFPLGELVKLGKGVCRHQCILEHLLLQQAGIDSRLASGAANTSGGDFRGYHIWTEVSLADGSRFLSDQTWNDATIPLWNGAYDSDKRRIEMYNRTARYDGNIELSN